MTELFRPSRVDHAPDTAFHALGDVQRAVRRLCDTIGAIGSLVRRSRRLRAGKPVGEHFELAGRLAVSERLEGYVVAILQRWRAVPRSMKGDERTAPVLRRQQCAG